MGLLQKNERQAEAKTLTQVMGYFALIERQLDTMADELHTARQELANMREERDHPARAMCQRMAKALTARIKAAKQWLESAKDGFVEGAKIAVDAVKKTGIAALDGAMGFLDVKNSLAAMRDSLAKSARSAGRTIEKIEAISGEYHAVGSQLRNLGRALVGKEKQQDIRPDGKLAHISKTLFKNVQGVLNGIAQDADKAVGLLDRLEKAAEQNREKKASIADTLQAKKQEAAMRPVAAPNIKKQLEVSI